MRWSSFIERELSDEPGPIRSEDEKMDRRDFLKSAGIAGLSYGVTGLFLHWAGTTRLEAADPSPDETANPNWAQSRFKPQAKASSYFIDPPWGYQPANIFDPDEHIGWESNEQLSGAWLEVSFPFTASGERVVDFRSANCA